MSEPDRLKLIALDEEDLPVISACVQDAVLKVRDLVPLPAEKRFVVAMNRFTWEKQEDGRRTDFERRRAALTFDRVTAVKASRIHRDRPDSVLQLLAVTFEPTTAPAGFVTLVFAGGGAVRLEVECIEARLADYGAAWAARAKPDHETIAEAKPNA